MCVVAIAWEAHPEWRLLVAGNRDEFHARASAPLARWDDDAGMIAGRDLVSGGTWMGVSDAGRFAVVTNIRDADGPDPEKASRGALVADWLTAGQKPDNVLNYNPFNLVCADGKSVHSFSNRPRANHQPLGRGIHGLSNAIPNEHWPRTDRLIDQMRSWMAQAPDHPELLLGLLRDEDKPDREAHPLFIRSPVYGTRCSTVVAVNTKGQGQIIERRFDANGVSTGKTALRFDWSQ